MALLRSFVFYGQGGRLTSFGMDALADGLRQLGAVSVHEWWENVAPAVNRCEGRVALFGFSLGANQLGWLGSQFEREVDLGVALDPSRQSPLCRRVNNEWVQTAPNYARLVCFYNPGVWLFGGSRYVGDNVEVVRVRMAHLAVPLSGELRRTALRLASSTSLKK